MESTKVIGIIVTELAMNTGANPGSTIKVEEYVKPFVDIDKQSITIWIEMDEEPKDSLYDEEYDAYVDKENKLTGSKVMVTTDGNSASIIKIDGINDEEKVIIPDWPVSNENEVKMLANIMIMILFHPGVLMEK